MVIATAVVTRAHHILVRGAIVRTANRDHVCPPFGAGPSDPRRTARPRAHRAHRRQGRADRRSRHCRLLVADRRGGRRLRGRGHETGRHCAVALHNPGPIMQRFDRGLVRNHLGISLGSSFPASAAESTSQFVLTATASTFLITPPCPRAAPPRPTRRFILRAAVRTQQRRRSRHVRHSGRTFGPVARDARPADSGGITHTKPREQDDACNYW